MVIYQQRLKGFLIQGEAIPSIGYRICQQLEFYWYFHQALQFFCLQIFTGNRFGVLFWSQGKGGLSATHSLSLLACTHLLFILIIETDWPNKFQPFLNFKAQLAFHEIEMKQKQHRNALKGDKYKKGNLTETIKVKKVT